MKCPYCGALESRVVDSRGLEEEVRRRRVCSVCGTRFTTSERVQAHAFYVVKKDGRREEFDSEKLASGIRKACEKRPLPTGSVDKLVSAIEESLLTSGRAEISSTVIGDLVMTQLASLDHIAYIRFASVYREFTDIGALKDALDSLPGNESPQQAPCEGPLQSQR